MSAHDDVVGLCTSEPPPFVPINSRFRSRWRLTCFVDMPLPGRTHDVVVGWRGVGPLGRRFSFVRTIRGEAGNSGILFPCIERG